MEDLGEKTQFLHYSILIVHFCLCLSYIFKYLTPTVLVLTMSALNNINLNKQLPHIKSMLFHDIVIYRIDASYAPTLPDTL